MFQVRLELHLPHVRVMRKVRFTIENAAWQAARAIRTGQVQQSQGAYVGLTTNDDRKKAFKKALCDKAPLRLRSSSY